MCWIRKSRRTFVETEKKTTILKRITVHSGVVKCRDAYTITSTNVPVNEPEKQPMNNGAFCTDSTVTFFKRSF